MYVTPWINLKNIMLSERCQTQKATCYMILFMWNVQNRQILRDRTSIRYCQGGAGRGTWALTANGHGGFLLGWWKYSRIREWWWLQSLANILKSTALYTLNNMWILQYINYILIKKKSVLKWAGCKYSDNLLWTPEKLGSVGSLVGVIFLGLRRSFLN